MDPFLVFDRSQSMHEMSIAQEVCRITRDRVGAEIPLSETELVFIENVGNLVCPASWDLGETAKVVVFSVTEGEDKPLKYPKMFREARFAVLNKMDLLPHVPFDLERAISCSREVNPDLRLFFTSALTGVGMPEWYDLVRSLARPR